MSLVATLRRRLRGERRAARADSGRRRSDRLPKRGWVPSLVIGLTIALVDWGVKGVILSTMPLGAFREIVPGRVALWHVRNPAMILGLWGSLPLAARQAIGVLAILVGALVLVEIVGRGHRLPPRGQRLAWVFVGLVLGGMLGNLGERLVHFGVTDYLSIRWGAWWLPPGNVADLALFLSIPLAIPVLWMEIRERARRRPADEEDGADAPAPATRRPLAG